MKTQLAAAIAIALLSSTRPTRAAEPVALPLWPGGAPGALGAEVGDANHAGDVPTITVYPAPAEKSTGASVVVCPGGGYGFLATDHEGVQVARWLNGIGVTAVVLKYRLGPRYRHPAMIDDAHRAIRTVRARAAEWHLDPRKVAVLGFSAGGHLASTAATQFDAGRPGDPDPVERESCRPDRAILVYPVVALATPYGHSGSKENLLGKDAPEALVRSLSNETRVTKDTPPTFLAHTNADEGVPAENSILFALACRKAGVPVELHLFETGRHGLGLGTGWAVAKIDPDPNFSLWPGLCEAWLRAQGFLDPPAPRSPNP